VQKERAIVEVMRDVRNRIKARYWGLGVISQEERRVMEALCSIAEASNMDVRRWSLVTGFTTPDGEPIDKTAVDPKKALISISQTPGRHLFVLCNFHWFLDKTNPANIPVIQIARELAATLKSTAKEDAKTVVFLGPELNLPIELQTEITVLRWPLPDTEELEVAVKAIIEEVTESRKEREAAGELSAPQREMPDDLGPIIQAALGLTLDEVQNCLAKSVVSTGTLDAGIISAEKEQIAARSGVVSWVKPRGGLGNVGGLEGLKTWLAQRKPGFSRAAADYGLDAPKGILIYGVPGCGKSLSVECVAAEWGLPLLRAGEIMGGLVGESEGNLDRLFATAEAVAPCILFFDEVEKYYAGAAGSGAGDSGVGKRVFGKTLTWMQSPRSAVFVAATANEVENLPAEFLRKGRFDEIFFVDLPSSRELAEIWRIHITKRKRDPEKFDIPELVRRAAGMTGAEIEAVLLDAMFRAFSSGEEVTDQHISEALTSTVPLSKTAEDRIRAIREWGQGRAKPASAPEEGMTSGSRFGGLDI
jgi:SpoVK/Ycf46/Vps4 family AAA+-type ATPase